MIAERRRRTQPLPMSDLSGWLSAEASALGFDVAGVTRPEAGAVAGLRLREYIADGRHGDMSWLAETVERRADPRALWPEARSVIMLAMSYAPEQDPMAALARRDRGVISVYAKGRDYHEVLKGRLKILAGKLAARARAEVKVFVDTAPLMEKPLAAAAGLGWQGKHTNLVSRQHGSWLFLGAILTTAELSPSMPETDRCGSCRRCLDVCPTDAFPAPYQLDARRCLAYLSIEHKGQIPLEMRRPMGNRVFGCDDCLAVCPWNKFAAAARETRLKARAETDDPALRELVAMDDAAFRARFAGTPVKRTGRHRVVRNALVAAGNSGDEGLVTPIARCLDDASPLVRGMAVWALARLAGREQVAMEAIGRVSAETDPGVIAEWQTALGCAETATDTVHAGETA